MQGFEGEVEQSGFEFLEPQEKDGILDQYLQRLRYEWIFGTRTTFIKGKTADHSQNGNN
jgi:hypothetical protein